MTNEEAIAKLEPQLLARRMAVSAGPLEPALAEEWAELGLGDERERERYNEYVAETAVSGHQHNVEMADALELAIAALRITRPWASRRG